jgi:hypothetical protein
MPRSSWLLSVVVLAVAGCASSPIHLASPDTSTGDHTTFAPNASHSTSPADAGGGGGSGSGM